MADSNNRSESVTPLPARRPAERRTRVAWVIGAVLFLGLASITIFRPKGSGSVQRVNSANPALQLAAKRAQSELDSFIAELARPTPDERFAILGAFKTDQGNEYLWVKDPSFADGKFKGVLAQPPIAYREAAKGDPVTVGRKDVFDWKIKTNDGVRGGYTDKALSR